MPPPGDNSAALSIVRLQSDLGHLSSAIDRLSKLVIDDGENSLAMRVVLLERGLSDLKEDLEKLRVDMDYRLGKLMLKLEKIEALLEKRPESAQGADNALVASNKALVETNKALSDIQTEGIKGKWAIALVFASGFTGAISALVTAWLKAKFGS